MNTFLAKIVVLALFSALFQGCASVPPTAYSTGGYYNRYGGGVYIQPCQPYDGSAATSWATSLGNSQHSRSATITNYNGNVGCSMVESASSRTGGR